MTTESVTLRVPIDILEQIDAIASGSITATRTSVMVELLNEALTARTIATPRMDLIEERLSHIEGQLRTMQPIGPAKKQLSLL